MGLGGGADSQMTCGAVSDIYLRCKCRNVFVTDLACCLHVGGLQRALVMSTAMGVKPRTGESSAASVDPVHTYSPSAIASKRTPHAAHRQLHCMNVHISSSHSDLNISSRRFRSARPPHHAHPRVYPPVSIALACAANSIQIPRPHPTASMGHARRPLLHPSVPHSFPLAAVSGDRSI